MLKHKFSIKKYKGQNTMKSKNKKYIHEAVRSGNFVQVNQILRSDPSCVNDWNLEFETPLHLVYKDVDFLNPIQADYKLPLMQLLIDYGANVNAIGPTLETPLYLAVEKQQINGVELLLKHNANPNIMNQDNYTALHCAAFKNSLNIIKLLLDYGVDNNIINNNDETPLDVAISFNRITSAKKLIEFSAESHNIYKSLLNACIRSMESPLENKLFIKYILRHADQIDAHRKYSHKALLCHAVFEEHENDHKHRHDKTCFLLELLYEEGVKASDGFGYTSLHIAALNGNKKSVEALLQKGGDVQDTNFFGETPLHSIFRVLELENEDTKVYTDIAVLLIENGADFFARNCVSETPFFLAAKKKFCKILLFMMSNVTAAKSKYQVNEKNLPSLAVRCCLNELHELIIASIFHNDEVVRRLLNKSYIQRAREIYLQDVNGTLRAAIDQGNYNNLKMLLEGGLRTDRRFSSNISRFLKTQCNENDLSIVCLLWEFGDSETIHRAMIDAFRVVVECSVVNEFIYLLTFYYAIYLETTVLRDDLIPAKGLFKLHKTLSNILSDCKNQLNELKKAKAGDLFIFDIITMRLDALVRLLDDGRILHDCYELGIKLGKIRKLDYYEFALQIRIHLALERKNLSYEDIY